MATASSALALPTAPSALCSAQPELPMCQGAVPSCALCHEGTDPPRWNAFGEALKRERTAGADFESDLIEALAAIAEDDADGDGISNDAELRAGSAPGVRDARESGEPAVGGASNPRYRVGAYDYEFAYRRVAVLYCARSPSYEELERLRAGKPDDETLKTRVHEKLTSCLESAYWRGEGLARLADKRIRPLFAAGPQTDIKIGSYRLVIGVYDYDYRLWRYILTGDRDLRELLTAKYHVQQKGDALTKVTGVLAKSDPEALAGGQPIPEERRAGMLTTQWFLAINTMFSALPRTTAAQAYRAYLGADISSGEGLRPVAGEPLDVDDKGVDAPRCANCHSTLDPLTYAFTEYEGIRINADLRFGDYIPERPRERVPGWDPARQKSSLLGVEVPDLVAWAKVAAASDEFKRAMAQLFFEHALGRAPAPSESEEFIALWRSLPDDGYSANKLLHRLIDTLAFGRP